MIQQSAKQAARHAVGPGASAPTAPPRIALVGVHGFGERHLANLARLEAAGVVELVAVADPHPPQDGTLPGSVAVFNTLDQLLAAGAAPDVVILATPIQTHAPLALAALTAGADIYVEKPPVASMAQFQDLLAAADASGQLVQVGFQSLGSARPARDPQGHRLRRDRRRPGAERPGHVGADQGVLQAVALGRQTQPGRHRRGGRRGHQRAGTCGSHRTPHGRRAHRRRRGFRGDRPLPCPHTQSDDTSVIRVRTAAGQTLLCALTLCAPNSRILR